MKAKAHKAHVTTEQPSNNAPPHHEIAQRAYELFLARGATDGHDVEDWLRAEAELRSARESA
jgi:DUF2934 family protein